MSGARLVISNNTVPQPSSDVATVAQSSDRMRRRLSSRIRAMNSDPVVDMTSKCSLR